MSRIGLSVGLMMALVVVAAGVAVAVTRQCQGIPCRGTDNADVLHERVGSVKDRILGLRGSDRIEAATFNNERDKLEGGPNGDRLLTNDGDGRDVARGGRGNDRCLVDRGDSTRSCEEVDRATTAQVGKLPAWFKR
jgi:hypothetical protein